MFLQNFLLNVKSIVNKDIKKYKNCIGEVNGCFTVIDRIPRPVGKTQPDKHWVKIQCVCGKKFNVPYSEFPEFKSCGCADRMRGPNHKDWRGHGEISLEYFNSCKRRAAGGGKFNKPPKEFTVTIEYVWDLFLKQNRKCALSGAELTFDPYGCGKKYKETNKMTASLDRINSEKGYVPGNVQWIHKHINSMKNEFSQEKLIEYCKLIAKNNP